MNSINSGVTLRDQRMRELLFETALHPTATIEVAVPTALLNSLTAGQSTHADVSATVRLHGVEKAVTARVLIQRLSNSRVLVQSVSPPLARAADFGLAEGVEQLRAVVNLVSISSTVPVDFAFAFDAR
jgi:polyisoprenoid-binding protein YceI